MARCTLHQPLKPTGRCLLAWETTVDRLPVGFFQQWLLIDSNVSLYSGVRASDSHRLPSLRIWQRALQPPVGEGEHKIDEN